MKISADRILGSLNIILALVLMMYWYNILIITNGYTKMYTTPLLHGIHLLAEFVTVILLIFSGFRIIRSGSKSCYWYPYALGMLAYSALYNSGYLLQRSEITGGILAAALWLMTITFIILYSRNQGIK